MKYIPLNNGTEMPVLGFGVYQIPDHDTCKESVLKAIKAGYRSIDTASAYQNEVAVGAAIKESGIPREEFFITTKLWIADNGYENTQKAIETSLTKLGTSYVDLYLIHQPYGDVHGSWRAMEEAYEAGKLKALGVSNFHPDRVMDLIVNNTIKPAVNQIETHVFYQRKEDHQFLKEEDIVHESWAPYAEGKNDFFTNEVLQAIGNKYQKSVAQVALRFMIEKNIVVIPKSVNEDRIKENFDVFDFELSADDIQQIEALDTNKSLFFSHRDPEIIKWFSTMIE
ncbi:aldo/keto reductase [Leeuwenhoekiella palythoae]|uniref:aldo/keto reductase n=1 Tax=Leeuwenhoekiella palythoae TaxID=573501 RepID=UPI003516290B